MIWGKVDKNFITGDPRTKVIVKNIAKLKGLKYTPTYTHIQNLWMVKNIFWYILEFIKQKGKW